MEKLVKKYTGQDKPSELSVVTKAKDLAEYVLRVTEKSPKKFRFTFVTRLHNLCFDILTDIFYANNVYVAGDRAEALLAERRKYQQHAKVSVKLLAYISDMAQDSKAITFHQYEVICRMTSDELKLLNAWIKSDKRRFAQASSLISAESGEVVKSLNADLPTEQV